LKLHAAGNLSYYDGLLYYRGSYGYCWSSTQYSSDFGWFLSFDSGLSGIYAYRKESGLNVRCLRD
jgi:hypothetical protein